MSDRLGRLVQQQSSLLPPSLPASRSRQINIAFLHHISIKPCHSDSANEGVNPFQARMTIITAKTTDITTMASTTAHRRCLSARPHRQRISRRRRRRRGRLWFRWWFSGRRAVRRGDHHGRSAQRRTATTTAGIQAWSHGRRTIGHDQRHGQYQFLSDIHQTKEAAELLHEMLPGDYTGRDWFGGRAVLCLWWAGK